MFGQLLGKFELTFIKSQLQYSPDVNFLCYDLGMSKAYCDVRTYLSDYILGIPELNSTSD